MKESISPLLAALAILSACAKVETAPSSPDGIAISFSPVLGSVKTKASTDAEGDTGMATADTVAEGESGTKTKANAAPKQTFKFYSYAWYLSDGKTWDSSKADAEPYIVNETVSNQGGEWKSPTNTYYWPHSGSLTFLSYTCVAHDDQGKLYDGLFTGTANGTVSVDKASGLAINGFINYRTGDLLVADIARDRRADLNGVPTIFKHKLARISFYISKEESQTQDEYVLTGLKLTGIYDKGDYSGGGYATDSWSNRREARDYDILSENTLDVSNDFLPVGSSVMVIPQNLLATAQGENDSERQAPQIIISYYTKNDAVPKDITRDLKVLGTNIWDKGKDYKYYITFGSGDQPIDFGGSIGDWEDKDNSGVDIGTK